MDIPAWIVILFFLAMLGILYEIGVLQTLFGLFSWIYGFVKPKRTSTKIIVALISVMFGFFAIMILGGPIGMVTPVFLAPIGFLIALLILIPVSIVIVIILRIVIEPFDSQLKTSTRDAKQISRRPKTVQPSKCILCSNRIFGAYYTCRNCNAVFCTDPQCISKRRNLDHCPNCGKPLKLDYHSSHSRTPEYLV